MNFSYGTAGFRGDAGNLISTVFRCGVLAALRSLCTRQVTGLMITASHNPVQENGVKLADPQGGMLVMGWEMYADALANAADHEAFLLVRNLRYSSIAFCNFLCQLYAGSLDVL